MIYLSMILHKLKNQNLQSYVIGFYQHNNYQIYEYP
jgi:hypothetical protein